MVIEPLLGERLVRLTIRLIRVDSRSHKRCQTCVGILVGLPLPRSFDKLRMTGGFLGALGERLVRVIIRQFRVDSRSHKRCKTCVGILVGLPLPRSFDKLRMTSGY